MPMPGLIDRLREMQADRTLSQGGFTIPQILDAGEQAFMQQVWPQIRVAAQFSHPNWAALGFPDGPPLSPVSYAAMNYVWPQVRVAADFSHPRWELHPVPAHIVAAALPVPEVPTPTAAPPTPAPPAPSGPSFTYSPPSSGGPISYDPIPDDAAEEVAPVTTPVKAGLFGGLSMPVILTAVGAVLFFSLARGAGQTRTRRRRR
jgi:hypothetical protein